MRNVLLLSNTLSLELQRTRIKWHENKELFYKFPQPWSWKSNKLFNRITLWKKKSSPFMQLVQNKMLQWFSGDTFWSIYCSSSHWPTHEQFCLGVFCSLLQHLWWYNVDVFEEHAYIFTISKTKWSADYLYLDARRRRIAFFGKWSNLAGRLTYLYLTRQFFLTRRFIWQVALFDSVPYLTKRFFSTRRLEQQEVSFDKASYLAEHLVFQGVSP